MANSRQSRDDSTRATYDARNAVTETRATQERPVVDSWKPPSILPEINKRDGWAHRWVRTSLLSKADNTNVSARFREGWEPCKLSEYPELKLSVDPGSIGADRVEVGGLLLCRMPTEMIRQRDAYFSNAKASQVESVDSSYMKENDPRMPLFAEKKSATSFGRGSR